MNVPRILSLILVALAMVLGPTPALAQCAARPLLAMTYNIRLDTPSDGDNAWAHRKHLLIGQIATMRPDLLGLQEVLLGQKTDLESALPGYRFVGAGRDDGKLAGEFSPLAIDTAAFRIDDSGTFWLSPTPDVPSKGWDAGYPRVATWARLTRRSDGARLLAINTHWDHQGLVARREGGALILRWIEQHRKRGERLVLLGDFNAEIGEESVAQILKAGLRLQDTRRAARQGSFGPALSFNGFDAFPREGKLIDHIFVDPAISVRSHGVIAQHENGRVGSDHFPVAALFDLPSRRACRR